MGDDLTFSLHFFPPKFLFLPRRSDDALPSFLILMAQRRKCTTDFIQNDKARLSTFQRRSHCLLKKASELSTLCDVDVAVLIYADHLSDRPLTFPPEAGHSLRIIKKLKSNPRCVRAAISKPDKFLNQEKHCKRPNDDFCDDIMSLNADELGSLVRMLDAKEEQVLKKINTIRQRENEKAVAEVSDPNRFLFRGNDHHSHLFDHQPHVFQWPPIPFSVMGDEDTAKSKSEQLTENNSGFQNQISGHLTNNYDDAITSMRVSELDSLAKIRDAMEEDYMDTIAEMSDPMTNCWKFSELFSDEFSDPDSFFLSGDGHPTPSVSEITTDLESEFFDCLPLGFQWPVPCSYDGDDDTPISEPHHLTLTENRSGSLDSVVPNLDVEPEEAKDESNMVNEKSIETRDWESFCESSDFQSLASIFYEELPGTNSLLISSENTMYHQYESLDYQPSNSPSLFLNRNSIFLN